MAPRVARFVMAVIVGGGLCVAPAACGSSSRPTDIISAGQVDLQLPAGWKVTHDGATAPAGQGSSAAVASRGGVATTTIPLAKQNPTTEFFQATASFTSCLKALGVTFIGTPDPTKPSSPANDPSYLKSLETCAAQSHILQAIKDFQSAQAKLTTKQIQQENEAYLRWRTCMIGRGWTVPEPVPNSQGELFYFSANSPGPQITPPPGQNPISSPDIQDCETQALQNTSAGQG
jgi:hypothetical protein